MSDGLNDTRTDANAGSKDQADALLSLVAEQDARIKHLSDLVASLIPAHVQSKPAEAASAVADTLPTKEDAKPFFVSKAGRTFTKESYERWQKGIKAGMKAAHAKRAEIMSKRREVRPSIKPDADNGFLHAGRFTPGELRDFSPGEVRVYGLPKGIQSLAFIEEHVKASAMKFDFRTAFLVMHEPDSHAEHATNQFSAPTARTVVLIRRLS